MSIHPSIFLTSYQVVEPEPISAYIGWEAGYTLDMVSVDHRANADTTMIIYTHIHILAIQTLPKKVPSDDQVQT